MTNAAVAAIQFALETDDGLNFLRLWNEGEFDILREEWPDAPEDVYIGADPLYKVTSDSEYTKAGEQELILDQAQAMLKDYVTPDLEVICWGEIRNRP